MRTRWPSLAALIPFLAVVFLGGCTSHSKSSAPTTAPPGTPPGAPPRPPSVLRPPAVPSTGAYLGAWVNPGHEGNSSAAGAEMAQLNTILPAVKRPLGILHVYTKWSAPAPIPALTAISNMGSVPLVDWGCTSTASIRSGQQDAVITAYARALKSYGKPVFLRWFWEMNLVNIRKNRTCLGSGGPAGFVAAWQRIYSLFQKAGATNVAFVWCPGNANDVTSPYYPGDGAVNWIATDGYAGPGQDFASVFRTFYEQYRGNGKPIMIAETGAPAADQAAYLASILASAPSEFAQVKAVVYFDAPGPRRNWSLTPRGLAAFAQLAQNAYFSERG